MERGNEQQHIEQTLDLWRNCAPDPVVALEIAYRAIPKGDTVKAETFCALLLSCVRGDRNVNDEAAIRETLESEA